MKFMSILFPSLFALLWFNPAATHENATATVAGKVTYADNQPLAAVTVTAMPGQHTTLTDNTGRYVLQGLSPGLYTITFTHAHATSETRKDIQLWAGKTTNLHVNMQLSNTLHVPVPLKEIQIVEDAEYAAPAFIQGVVPQHTSSLTLSKMANSPQMQYDSYVEDDGFNTEGYDLIQENKYFNAWADPLSTFSIDVDNAAYTNVRRFISQQQTPPRDAVRIEEMVNYFAYDYQAPTNTAPFSINMEVADCPWNEDHQLVHIGLQGKDIDLDNMAPSNLVFLIDVSGSMNNSNKLPLVKSSLNYLVDQLGEQDRIALVVYAGAAGLVLPSTPASEKDKIKAAINQLSAGGSTAGGAGIKLAYQVAVENLIASGNNRVIIATDGDFNVGQSSNSEMVQLMEEKRKTGIYITVMGFGMGNYKDDKMEKIAQYGNGNYFYIDQLAEAQKVFGKDLRATLFTIAKDVKIQVEFNPMLVASYRLIGYENRKLDNQDFADDTKDAGELGAGHTVTALYEIIPATREERNDAALKYQQNGLTAAADNGELLTLKLRYKDPKSTKSKLLQSPLMAKKTQWEQSSDNFRWSAAVALFGQLLRESTFTGSGSFEQVLALANGAKGADEDGLRQGFIAMVNQYVTYLAAK